MGICLAGRENISKGRKHGQKHYQQKCPITTNKRIYQNRGSPGETLQKIRLSAIKIIID